MEKDTKIETGKFGPQVEVWCIADLLATCSTRALHSEGDVAASVPIQWGRLQWVGLGVGGQYIWRRHDFNNPAQSFIHTEA